MFGKKIKTKSFDCGDVGHNPNTYFKITNLDDALKYLEKLLHSPQSIIISYDPYTDVRFSLEGVCTKCNCVVRKDVYYNSFGEIPKDIIESLIKERSKK